MVTYYGTIEDQGKIQLEGDVSDLPVGKRIQVRILVEDDDEEIDDEGISAQDLLNAPFIGVWADRDDIGDTVEFAEKIRRQWENRLDGPD